jgi:phosphopantothenoylcysteine decarboxylase/phosphopantothenate--cysteine ligase
MPKKNSNLAKLNILLGVSGGISAYKAVDLASKLSACGAKVRTVMTENACQLIRPKSFEAVTAQAVYTSLWTASEEYEISHVSLAEWADIVAIVPATANIIGKAANGICDDLLSTIVCTCWTKPTLLAPAMNKDMWDNPAVQRNVETIKKMGFEIIGPEKGRLACGTEGMGRMSEPKDILEALEKIASKIKRRKR